MTREQFQTITGYDPENFVITKRTNFVPQQPHIVNEKPYTMTSHLKGIELVSVDEDFTDGVLECVKLSNGKWYTFKFWIENEEFRLKMINHNTRDINLINGMGDEEAEHRASALYEFVLDETAVEQGIQANLLVVGQEDEIFIQQDSSINGQDIRTDSAIKCRILISPAGNITENDIPVIVNPIGLPNDDAFKGLRLKINHDPSDTEGVVLIPDFVFRAAVVSVVLTKYNETYISSFAVQPGQGIAMPVNTPVNHMPGKVTAPRLVNWM